MTFVDLGRPQTLVNAAVLASHNFCREIPLCVPTRSSPRPLKISTICLPVFNCRLNRLWARRTNYRRNFRRERLRVVFANSQNWSTTSQSFECGSWQPELVRIEHKVN